MWAAVHGETDQEIAKLEADLRQSQFVPWDAEKYLAARHQKKIDALTQPTDKWAVRRQVAVEISNAIFVLIGQAATMAGLGYWLLSL